MSNLHTMEIKGDDMLTRVIHDQKQSIAVKKEVTRIMLPQESTITRQATVRRVHIENQADSQTATRQATVRKLHSGY